MPVKPYQLKESDIQRTILDWLKARRIFHFRSNAGAMQMSYNGKKRFVRFGRSGQPDIFCVKAGQIIGIEVKGPDGEQSQKQLEFQIEFVRAGGVYILARSVEDVIRSMP